MDRKDIMQYLSGGDPQAYVVDIIIKAQAIAWALNEIATMMGNDQSGKCPVCGSDDVCPTCGRCKEHHPTSLRGILESEADVIRLVTAMLVHASAINNRMAIMAALNGFADPTTFLEKALTEHSLTNFSPEGEVDEEIEASAFDDFIDQLGL